MEGRKERERRRSDGDKKRSEPGVLSERGTSPSGCIHSTYPFGRMNSPDVLLSGKAYISLAFRIRGVSGDRLCDGLRRRSGKLTQLLLDSSDQRRVQCSSIRSESYVLQHYICHPSSSSTADESGEQSIGMLRVEPTEGRPSLKLLQRAQNVRQMHVLEDPRNHAPFRGCGANMLLLRRLRSGAIVAKEWRTVLHDFKRRDGSSLRSSSSQGFVLT